MIDKVCNEEKANRYTSVEKKRVQGIQHVQCAVTINVILSYAMYVRVTSITAGTSSRERHRSGSLDCVEGAVEEKKALLQSLTVSAPLIWSDAKSTVVRSCAPLLGAGVVKSSQSSSEESSALDEGCWTESDRVRKTRYT